MSEVLHNSESLRDNSAEENKFPVFDRAAAEKAVQERVRELANKAMDDRTGEDRYDLNAALDKADGYKERVQARANLDAYQEMHPDRNHEREMYRIAKQFGDIEKKGFEEPVPDQVPEGINMETYPQLDGESDEQYVERLKAMRDKTNELNGIPTREWTEKEKRRQIAKAKEARGEKIEYDEEGNYKF